MSILRSIARLNTCCVIAALFWLVALSQCANRLVHHDREIHVGYRENGNYLKIQAIQGSHAFKWEDHVNNLPTCSKESLEDLTKGKWYIDNEGHYMYEPDKCVLHRISGEAARRCMSGKHIVFAGDSISRYQYIHFGYFLSRFKRMEPYGARPGHPSLCIEKEWSNWTHYYEFSSAALGAVIEGCGHEVCDCSRPHGAPRELLREYRTLYITFPEDCQINYSAQSDSQEHITISYQQIFRDPDPLTAGLDALGYYEQSYRQQPPSLLIFNMGHHIRDLGANYKATLSTMLKKGGAVNQKHNTQLLWKTTTDIYDWRNDEIETALASNFSMYDVGRMVASIFEQNLSLQWDGTHFLPFVYEQFNDVLFNNMC